MLKVSGIHLPLDAAAADQRGVHFDQAQLTKAAATALGIAASQIVSVDILRRSVDARRKSDVHFVLSAAVQLSDTALEEQLASSGIARYQAPEALEPIQVSTPPAISPVVVGSGPAGLFAALYLARAGMRPLLVERGQRVDERAKSVARFNATGELDIHSNIQFGEGGAGTFSDGKLTTNTNNAYTRHVLQWFVDAGAPQDILVDAQPHIGSDRLPAVVATMRDEIIERGGEVCFDTRLDGLFFDEGHLAEIALTQVRTGTSKRIPCTQLVLACGHSARDTFALVQQSGLAMHQKPFSVGLRIEHPQSAINRAQWGSAADHPALGATSYKLVAHACAGRSVYTFCMCPGGEVLCAASEEGGIVTNGMSPFARDGAFANAAVLVGVGPSDFGDATDPCAGIYFQRQIEQRAWAAVRDAGGKPYQVPAQTVGSFLEGISDTTLPASSCARGVVPLDLRSLLPRFVGDAIAEALPAFERKLAGFASPDALLLGPETRSSSPVHIARNEHLQAQLVDAAREDGCGIYPAGEGAGHAGGIMSAACDGLRVATALVTDFLAHA